MIRVEQIMASIRDVVNYVSRNWDALLPTALFGFVVALAVIVLLRFALRLLAHKRSKLLRFLTWVCLIWAGALAAIHYMTTGTSPEFLQEMFALLSDMATALPPGLVSMLGIQPLGLIPFALGVTAVLGSRRWASMFARTQNGRDDAEIVVKIIGLFVLAVGALLTLRAF